MFDDFLYNFYRSVKLDKNLYKDRKIFENLSFSFAALIVLIGGFAGLFAQNTLISFYESKYLLNDIPSTNYPNVIFSSILGWIVWAALIYVIGGKLFSEVNTAPNFKKILIVVGYGHAPAVFRFLIILPDLSIPIILITEIWIFISIAIGIREVLNFKSSFKSVGVVIVVFLIMLTTFIFLISKNPNFIQFG